MKYLFLLFMAVIFLMIGAGAGFLVFGCHSAVMENQPLNITISEVEESEMLYSYPMAPWHIFCFSKCRGVVVASIFYVDESIVVRYCYLEQGKLVGFAIDSDFYEDTHGIRYVVDVHSNDEVLYMTEMLARVAQGLPPINESEFEESETNEI
jgi:hypothetical protein